MKWRIAGGRVIDPSQNLDDLRDVLVEDDRIVDLVWPGRADGWAEPGQVLPAQDSMVVPGLIDLHVHLREPGHEYKETIASGTTAAAAGGFTAVTAMPNTHPVADQRTVIEYVVSRAREGAKTRVWPLGAMTVGQRGEELCEYADLAEAGAVGVSDDGRWVAKGQVMRRVLEYAQVFGLTAVSHPEDLGLSAGGLMNEGRTATALGLAGISAAAEDVAVYRDIRLAQLTGVPVHLAHISTKVAVDLIRAAKAQGVPVTAETAPHYFTLTEEAVIGYRTEAKMNPPLRTEEDVAAIRAGLADGTIDAIATDHAPHAVTEKDVEFDQAANGIIGLETSLALALDLVKAGLFSLSRLVELMSLNPARILGVPGGSLKAGQPADLTIIAPHYRWVCDPAKFRSKSRNTPFVGREMTGRAILTMVGGQVTHRDLAE